MIQNQLAENLTLEIISEPLITDKLGAETGGQRVHHRHRGHPHSKVPRHLPHRHRPTAEGREPRRHCTPGGKRVPHRGTYAEKIHGVRQTEQGRIE